MSLLWCNNLPEKKYNLKFQKWYSCVLDIINTNIFKRSHADNSKT